MGPTRWWKKPRPKSKPPSTVSRRPQPAAHLPGVLQGRRLQDAHLARSLLVRHRWQGRGQELWHVPEYQGQVRGCGDSRPDAGDGDVEGGEHGHFPDQGQGDREAVYRWPSGAHGWWKDEIVAFFYLFYNP